ncbi:hypothetical protein FHW37_11548 [Neorhizobium alkalisoli]|uniref:AB hydrolase-1 domain-containing protein n=2 Tax=Neorhizobium alkalisoli TaxID=528178 RepID=A0A561Q7L5_9HYPH|nr:hypothetical protein FHW37_11548 [Neorhizobium alkalisoli]
MKSRMSTVHFVFAVALATVFSVIGSPATAQEGPLKPFKDELFSKQTILEKADNGDYEIVDYQEMRDINGRDREPEMHVRSQYIDTAVRSVQEDQALVFGDRKLNVTRVGQAEGEAFVVIFIHGRGGDRRLGVDDQKFGGNFNRLKNLVVRNGGTYYSVSVPAFDDKGAADVGALIRYAFEQAAGRPVILACASMGGILCQHITRDKETVRYMAGMVLLGGPPDPGLPTTPFVKLGLPIYFAHGSADKVYAAQDQIDIYRKLHLAKYPVRFTLFATGSHGTPIRMVDWRKVLNFVLVAHR